MAHEHEVEWQSSLGVSYELQSTVDLQSWKTVQTFQGTGGKLSYVEQTIAKKTIAKKLFRVKQTFKDGNEPSDLRAVIAFDGSYIVLEWSLYLSPIAGTFKIVKDNQQLAEVPLLSYQNSYVHSQPGPAPHTYSVTYWS